MNRDSATNSYAARKAEAAELARRGHLAQAKLAFEAIIDDRPDDYDCWLHLGQVCQQLGQVQEAIRYYEKLVAETKYLDAVYNNLGMAYESQNNFDAALAAYREALQITPANYAVLFNLGNMLAQRGQLQESVIHLRKASMLNKREWRILMVLGSALTATGQLAEAEAVARAALELKPDDSTLRCNLGQVLIKADRISEATRIYRKTLKLDPDCRTAHVSLGNIFLTMGDAVKAEKYFTKAWQIAPEYERVHSNILFALNYHRDDAERLLAAHLRWADRQAGGLQPQTPPKKAHVPKRLRIGYVSPDFCGHSVAHFFEPIIRHHDRSAFEIVCYSNTSLPDATTTRIKQSADHWRDIVGLPDDQVADRIRADEIDILVDLAGHTANNRLLVFARKPAPIQVSYLGYPNTTGLRTVDYRLTDRWADPEGAEHWHTEKLVRLPQGFLCYQMPAAAPEAGAPPSQSNGHVTFGSFNILAKTTPEVMRTWAAIMQRVPDSRLIMKSAGLADEDVRKRVRTLFQQQGIAPDRLQLMGRLQAVSDHLALYHRLDVALDPFPYNGTTTTCEALWMGVPVVALQGKLHAGRVGWSLMNQIGLPELVGANQDDYVEIAVQLARDECRRLELRHGLRARLEQSPLCDEPGFVQSLETAYHNMWRRT